MLLLAHFLALGVAVMLFVWIIFLQRRRRAAEMFHHSEGEIFMSRATLAIRPTIWLAVRSLESETVRAVLQDKQGFLISPRVNGWVIVTGSSLPVQLTTWTSVFVSWPH